MEITEIRQLVESEMSSRIKSQGLDGFLYNFGVVFTLACTGFATIVGAVSAGDNSIVPLWIPPLLSGLATIWIGIDRALQFGQRWRFHRAIAAKNETLLRRIKTLDLLPVEKQGAEIVKIREDFILLPGLNPDVPGLPPAETGKRFGR